MTALSPSAPIASPAGLDATALRLVNRYQHQLPVCHRPFAAAAETLELDEAQVLDTLQALAERGVLSRVGPVFEHRQAGASTLAALAVPPARLEAVARHVNGYREVNHNYEREHHWNLWFVVTAPNEAAVDAVLQGIAGATGLAPISLPMVHPFHIDLGFALVRTPQGQITVDLEQPSVAPAAAAEEADAPGATSLAPQLQAGLRRQLERGLPLVARPYRALAEPLGCTEADVLAQVRAWQRGGLFRRHGIVLRHHALGIRANLMLVLDVDDDRVDAVGRQLGAAAGVSLCYQRRRHLPEWRYNLFCMIHGHDRPAVARHAERLLAEHGLAGRPHEFLFSRRAFKQRGGRYLAPQPETCDG